MDLIVPADPGGRLLGAKPGKPGLDLGDDLDPFAFAKTGGGGRTVDDDDPHRHRTGQHRRAGRRLRRPGGKERFLGGRVTGDRCTAPEVPRLAIARTVGFGSLIGRGAAQFERFDAKIFRVTEGTGGGAFYRGRGNGRTADLQRLGAANLDIRPIAVQYSAIVLRFFD